jgi:hypothetical protein
MAALFWELEGVFGTRPLLLFSPLSLSSSLPSKTAGNRGFMFGLAHRDLSEQCGHL